MEPEEIDGWKKSREAYWGQYIREGFYWILTFTPKYPEMGLGYVLSSAKCPEMC